MLQYGDKFDIVENLNCLKLNIKITIWIKQMKIFSITSQMYKCENIMKHCDYLNTIHIITQNYNTQVLIYVENVKHHSNE